MNGIVLATLCLAAVAADAPLKKPQTPAPAAQPATPPATPPSRPLAVRTPAPNPAATWLRRATGIDVGALLSIVSSRERTIVERGDRLAAFDRATGRETTLWQCGGCWSPASVESGIAVLHGESDAATAVWLVPDSGEPRKIADVPGATVLVTLGGALHAAVTSDACTESPQGSLVLVRIDANAGTAVAEPGSPCFGRTMLTLPGRVQSEELLEATPRANSLGNPRTRTFIVLSPISDDAPDGRPFDPRLDGPTDRWDPIWTSATRIVYVTTP